MLLYIAAGLVGLILLLLIVSLFLPSQVHVEREAVIDAPQEVVFNQVNTLRNWEDWSPWHTIDPEMKLHYEGPPAGEGARYRWESDHRNVGNGSLTITRSERPARIETEMDFMEQGTAQGSYTFEPTNGGTRVVWAMDSDMGRNPVGRYFGLMMDRWIGQDFERGLANLKQVSEEAARKDTTGADAPVQAAEGH